MSLNICNDGHDEVCFEGRGCPVCLLREDKDSDILKLEDQITGLEKQIEHLEAQE